MEPIVQTGQFMADSFLALWTAFGTWGVIGVGIIAPAVIYKVVSVLKRILKN